MTGFASVLDTALACSPLQTAFRWRASRELAVLAYHDVTDTERFAMHMAYLKANAHPVSFEEVAAVAKGGGGLPKRAVLVTLDDGDRSVYDAGLPVFASLGIPAVTFVIGSLIDTDTPFWWTSVERLVSLGGRTTVVTGTTGAEVVRALKGVPNGDRIRAMEELRASARNAPAPHLQLRTEELRALESAGVLVGNHTMNHPCLPQCDAQEAVAEVTDCHARLTQSLGHAPKAFAFPNGDTDPRVVPTLSDLGYDAAFGFDHRLSAVPPRSRFEISRVRVNSTTSMTRFRILLSGLHSAVHAARQRFLS